IFFRSPHHSSHFPIISPQRLPSFAPRLITRPISQLFHPKGYRLSHLASSLVPFPNYFTPKATVFRTSPHHSSHFPIISPQWLPSFAPRLITRPISQLFHPNGYRLSHLASSLVPFPNYFIPKATVFRTSPHHSSHFPIISSQRLPSFAPRLITRPISNYFTPKATICRTSPHHSTHFPIISAHRLPSFSGRLKI